MEFHKKDIRALSLEELRAFFIDRGEQAFRGEQVYQWLWQKGVHDFEAMTNLSLTTRQLLLEHFTINHIAIDSQQKSKDGTLKNAVRLYDDLVVESVLIPTETRTTACVSSQVGCSLDCRFCATAQLKRMRNLHPDEIYDQVKIMDQQSRLYYGRPLSNVVFMGMGEPLMNYKNVVAAIDKITSSKGLGMASKRITLSTSGIPKLIERLADEYPKFNLAVSLHSARQNVREQIMPFANRFPLDRLMESLRYWYQKTNNRVTFEYVIWKGINDTQADIDALVQYCLQLPSKVNLIQYNSIGDIQFEQAAPQVVAHYQRELEKNGIRNTVRISRGADIDAACGQLANKKQ
ncbi:MAG: 23S rRNA (adenine(2503)-C(2))-methyltransferase RlmN [Flavobacteriaceae bacterium]